jgi:hypothetical protein
MAFLRTLAGRKFLETELILELMAGAKRSPRSISQIIDRIEAIREELLIIQRELETNYSAVDSDSISAEGDHVRSRTDSKAD